MFKHNEKTPFDEHIDHATARAHAFLDGVLCFISFLMPLNVVLYFHSVMPVIQAAPFVCAVTAFVGLLVNGEVIPKSTRLHVVAWSLCLSFFLTAVGLIFWMVLTFDSALD